MPSSNPKFKPKTVEWVQSERLGVDSPELKFFKDLACTERHDFQFPLTDRGSVAELPFYMRNMSEKRLFDVQLRAEAEPDKGWPSKRSAVGPMHLEVEPEQVESVLPGHIVAGKLVWRVGDDERCDKRRAAVSVEGRFTE